MNTDDSKYNTPTNTKYNGFFSFVSPTKQGWLTKQGGVVKNWKKRWFVLQDNRLYYYKSPKDGDPQGFIPLERCQVRMVPEKKNCFEIYDPAMPLSRYHPSFFITAETPAELKEWLDVLDSNANNNDPKLPSFEKMKIDHSGFLTKRGGMVKNWKKRWFALRGNYLCYYRAKGETQPLGCIPVDRATVTPIEENKYKRRFCFELTDPSNTFNKWHKTFILAGDSDKDRQGWISAILHAKTENDQSFLETPSKGGFDFDGSDTNTTETAATPRASGHQIPVLDPKTDLELPSFIIKCIKYLDTNGITIQNLNKTVAITNQQTLDMRKAVLNAAQMADCPVVNTLEKFHDVTLTAKLLILFLYEHFNAPLLGWEISTELVSMYKENSSIDPLHRQVRKVLAGKLGPETLLVLQYLLSFMGRISDRNELIQITQNETKQENLKGALGDLARHFGSLIIRTKNPQPGEDFAVKEIFKVLIQDYDSLFLSQ